MSDNGRSMIGVPVIDPLQMAWLPLSDLGNARRFVIRAGGHLRYVAGMGWYAFVGTHWSLEHGDERATQVAHSVAEGLRDELAALAAVADADLARICGAWCTTKLRDDHVGRLHTHSIKSGDRGRTVAMMAQAETLLAARMDDFDRDPLAFNTRTATLRFVKVGETWVVRDDEHEPADMISRLAEVDYRPNSPCPHWAARMEQIQPDEDQRALLQGLYGYALLGLTSEQKFALMQGRGGDGKSMTNAVIGSIMGTYRMHASVLTFLAGARKSGSDHSSDLARLAGDVRLVTCDEPERGSQFNTTIIKQITGSGKMTARGLRMAEMEYVPRWLLVMECNPLPRVPTSDDGFWRRCLLIPWPFQFKAAGVSPEPWDVLYDRLIGEASGILNWQIEGALRWLNTRRLPASKASAEAVDDYRRTSDPFDEWMMDRVDLSDPNARTLTKELHGDFKAFCEARGIEKVMGTQAFASKCAERQLRSIKSMGVMYRLGISLKPDWAGDSGAPDVPPHEPIPGWD